MKLPIISILIALLAAGLAMAAPTFDEVKVDGIVLTANSTLQVYRGETLEIDVLVSAPQETENLRLEAIITGTDTDDEISDTTQPFDIPANTRVRVRLDLDIPGDIERDEYLLRLHLTDKDTLSLSQHYPLLIDSPRRDVRIADVLLNPAGQVEAGQELLIGVRLENLGRLEERDLRILASIPTLELSAADYLEKLEPDDQAGIRFDHERALSLRIPRCAKPGRYDLVVEASYNKGRDMVDWVKSITIAEGFGCQRIEGPGLQVALEKGEATFEAGLPVQYTLTLTNNGASAQAFTLVTPAIEWADFTIAPSNTVLLESGASETLTITAIAKDAAPQGTFTLPLTITGGERPQTVTLTATIPHGGGPRVVNVDNDLITRLVLVGLVTMAVVLGIALFFSRRRPESR